MTIAVMTRVWKDAPVCGTELLMLLALADIASDEEMECYPSIKHLANKCRCSEKQAKRLLKSLERQGVIEIMVQAAKGRGKVKPGKEPNIYHITPDNWGTNDYATGDAQDPPHINTGDAQDPPTPPARVPPTGDAQDPLIPYRETLEESLIQSAKKLDPIPNTIKAWLDGQITMPINNQYENKGVRSNAEAIAKHFTPEQVTTYVKELASQSYWKGRLVAIGYVASNIAAYYAAKSIPASPSHIHLSSAPPDESAIPPPPEVAEVMAKLRENFDVKDKVVVYAKPA